MFCQQDKIIGISMLYHINGGVKWSENVIFVPIKVHIDCECVIYRV